MCRQCMDDSIEEDPKSTQMKMDIPVLYLLLHLLLELHVCTTLVTRRSNNSIFNLHMQSEGMPYNIYILCIVSTNNS